MALLDKISSFCGELGATVATGIRVVIMSRNVKAPERVPADREIVILGNGPSLRSLLDEHAGFLEGRDLMAVNFAANTPEFETLKPQHYILADPHFFEGVGSDPNVESLWQHLCEASHPMTLHVPASRRHNHLVRRYLESSPEHKTACFNVTPGEGFRRVRHALYSGNLAMPRPRNVMIPAIMQAIAGGYRKIFLAGADHTWSRTLSVDDENRVVSVQPHFYADSDSERQRVTTEYAGYHLHDILKSLYTAFSSYHTIADFAQSKGVEIVNITPGSFIDAFPRQKLC